MRPTSLTKILPALLDANSPRLVKPRPGRRNRRG
jgi:hypothetical protein